eukprot:3579804-Rhodomonas_salina.1
MFPANPASVTWHEYDHTGLLWYCYKAWCLCYVTVYTVVLVLRIGMLVLQSVQRTVYTVVLLLRIGMLVLRMLQPYTVVLVLWIVE